MGLWKVSMSEVKIVHGYTPGALGRVVELNSRYYADHWDFGLYFEAKAARDLADLLSRYDETRDGFWTARLDGASRGISVSTARTQMGRGYAISLCRTPCAGKAWGGG